jgi:hypothetical protein
MPLRDVSGVPLRDAPAHGTAVLSSRSLRRGQFVQAPPAAAAYGGRMNELKIWALVTA